MLSLQIYYYTLFFKLTWVNIIAKVEEEKGAGAGIEVSKRIYEF